MKNYEEFYDSLWGGISSSIVPEEFILKNKNLVDSITYDMYRMCDMEGNISSNIIRRIVESFMFHFLKFNVNLENND